MTSSRQKKQISAAKQPKPHMWIWHEESAAGGTVRFLLREGELRLTDNEKVVLEAGFREIFGVVGIRSYETYLAVEWRGLGSSFTFEQFEAAITKIGLPFLAQYFNWQGELRVDRVNSSAEKDELKRQEKLGSRWRLGER